MSEYGSTGSGDIPDEQSGRFIPPPPPPSPPSPPYDPSVTGGYPVGQAAFDVTPGSDDLIGSVEPTRRGRIPVLLAMVAVIVLVLAGGAFALVNNKATPAGALTKLVPAGSYGYIQLDLRQSSSAGLYEYLSHFPGSPATKPDASKATFRDTLLSSVFTKTDQINYGADIQPWLGNSAGIAVFRGSDGTPVPLVVIATTDAAKAKAGLAHIHAGDSSFAYEVVDGDALLAQHQSDLDEAQAQANAGSLPSAPNYSADIATLPSGSLVTMWADLDKITAAVKSAIAKECASGSDFGGTCSTFSSLTHLGVLGGLGSGSTSGGRVALGVTVSDKVATVTVRELGHKASAADTTVGTELKTLPADTTGAIALGNVSAGFDSAMKSLSSLGGLAALAVPTSGSGSSAVASAQAVPSGIPSGALASLEKNPAFASAFPSGVPSAAAGLKALSSGSVSTTSGTGSLDITKEIQQGVLSATGLSFPADFSAILGDRSVIAVGDIPLGLGNLKDLQVGIRSHPADLAKAQTLAQTLVQHVGKAGLPFQLGTKTAGSDLVLASSQSYADELATDGTLGATPQFAAAMGDLSTAQFAAYVDLSKFTGLLSATKDKSLSGFKAIGIVERVQGGDQVVQLNLIAG